MESKRLADKAVPLGNYPHAKRAGDFIFISGTSARQKDNSIVGATPDGKGGYVLDIAEQTAGVFENLKDILAGMGAHLHDLVEINAFLVDIADFAAYNAVYNRYLPEDGPCRTTVAVRELPIPELLIEMKAVAYKPF